MITHEEAMALISEHTNYSPKQPVFFLKFTQRQSWAKDILAGNLYANTAEFFRQQEEQTGTRGQGDVNEVSVQCDAKRIELSVQDSNGNHFLPHPDKAVLSCLEDEKKPIISFLGIPLNELTMHCQNDTCIEFGLPFSKSQIQNMKTIFGDYCVFISAAELHNSIERYCNGTHTMYFFDAVKYVPSDSKEKMQSFLDNNFARFYYKDEDLSYQHEYRLLFWRDMPDDHFFRLGKLQYAQIIDVSKLDEFHITFALQGS